MDTLSTITPSVDAFSRPDWDTYFLMIADCVSKRTDCRRGQVGAVLVDSENRIVSTGYPGVPPGRDGCLSGACPRGLLSFSECPSGSGYHLCPSDHRHAEWNAVAWADPKLRVGTRLYITRSPCGACLLYIREQGIVEIVYRSSESGVIHSMKLEDELQLELDLKLKKPKDAKSK